MKVLVAILLWCSGVWAGPFKVGNGGGGVIVGNNIYLLDFVEAGIEKTVYIDPIQKNYFRSLVEAKLNPAEFPTDLISQKFSEIYERNKVLALAAMMFLQQAQWVFVNQPLVKTDDIVPTVAIRDDEWVQLAVRRYSQVSLSASGWSKMPRAHQAGLIFHEIFSSLISRSLSNSDAELNTLARVMMGIVFSESSRSLPVQDFNHMLIGLPQLESPLLKTPPEWLDNRYWMSSFASPRSLKDFSFAAYLEVSRAQYPLVVDSKDRLDIKKFVFEYCNTHRGSTPVVLYVRQLALGFNTDLGHVDMNQSTSKGSYVPIDAQDLCDRHSEEKLQNAIMGLL